MVDIQCKFPAAHQPGQSPTFINRVEMDKRVGLVMAAMLQSSDGESLDATATAINDAGRALAGTDPANSSDMAAFTLQKLYYKGAVRGEPDEEGVSWVEVRNFECHGCPSNVD